MKASEIRELSVEELQTKLTELKEELFNLLSEWYYGGYKYLNGSSNISHVFDEKVAEAVRSIYYGNVDYVVEYEQKLTRKR